MRVGAVIAAGLGLAAMVGAAVVVLDWSAGSVALWLLFVAVVAAGAFRWGRWRAVAWLGVVPWAAASLLADAAWLGGLWDRSLEREPLPFSMFVIPLAVPTLAAAAALGVAARHARRAGRERAA